MSSVYYISSNLTRWEAVYDHITLTFIYHLIKCTSLL